MSTTKTTLVAILVVVLTFAAGVTVGFFASHIMILRGGHGAGFFPTTPMVNRLDRRLDLTDAQRIQVEEIIRRHRASIEKVRSGMHPHVRAEIEQANAEISRILTPEQRVKFERMKLHLGARRHERTR